MSNLRESGIVFGILPITNHNHICDIGGIEIGHETIHDGKNIHTGVTIIRPHGGNIVKEKAFASFYCGNGYGKFVGSTQIEELGHIESYIGLTNTLAVGTVMQELVRFHLKQQEDDDLISLNAIVGETNDGFLNDISSLSIKPEHVRAAISKLRCDNYEQGDIGAGAGTRAFGYKGGIGSACRVIPSHFTKLDKEYKLGVLMQSNYGGFLELNGESLWRQTKGHRFEEELRALEESKGSCIILVATDAPFLPIHLKRIAKRAVMALMKTGSFISHGSGDYALCWSTAEESRYISRKKENSNILKGGFLTEDVIDPFFVAITECVQEALFNSMTNSQRREGFRGTLESLSVKQIKSLLDKK